MCTACDIPLFICRFDFTRAYETVRHEAVLPAMYSRSVPVPVIMAYFRGMRSLELVFVCMSSRARPPISPTGSETGMPLVALSVPVRHRRCSCQSSG